MHHSVEVEFIGRTYDDFLLRPRLGVVPSRRNVSLRTSLSRRISLELPVVSANMDSVTGARMAQALALEGGIGFVHRATAGPGWRAVPPGSRSLASPRSGSP